MVGYREKDALESAATEELSALMERASNAARQMRYFSVAMRRLSLAELTSSATRAGFIAIAEYPELEEVSFQWGAGLPDLIFSAVYRDPDRVSIIAETQADVYGLILTAFSQASAISVEANPTIEDKELGENALLFQDMLLTFPGFDDVPAWTRYPEIAQPQSGGLVEMWRDGVCVAAVFGRTWNSISARVSRVWNTWRDRS